MKKSLLLLLVLAGVAGARGENLLTQGKSWVCEQDYRELTEDGWMSTTRRVDIEVTGDTIVDGKSCKVLAQTINGESEKLIGYEEDGMVYRVFAFNPYVNGSYKPYSVFVPLIDFNARKGNVLQTDIYRYQYESYEPQGSITVTDEETVTAYSTERRVVTLSNGAQWVAGVGASKGKCWLTTILMPNPTGVGAWVVDRDELIECRQDGKLIWKASDFTSIKDIEGACASGDALYDLKGRKVDVAVPGRIYIQGGKKFVVL